MSVNACYRTLKAKYQNAASTMPCMKPGRKSKTDSRNTRVNIAKTGVQSTVKTRITEAWETGSCKDGGARDVISSGARSKNYTALMSRSDSESWRTNSRVCAWYDDDQGKEGRLSFACYFELSWLKFNFKEKLRYMCIGSWTSIRWDWSNKQISSTIAFIYFNLTKIINILVVLSMVRLSILQFSIIYIDNCSGTKQVLAMTESPLLKHELHMLKHFNINSFIDELSIVGKMFERAGIHLNRSGCVSW